LPGGIGSLRQELESALRRIPASIPATKFAKPKIGVDFGAPVGWKRERSNGLPHPIGMQPRIPWRNRYELLPKKMSSPANNSGLQTVRGFVLPNDQEQVKEKTDLELVTGLVIKDGKTD
jgi:hypothetical protein